VVAGGWATAEEGRATSEEGRVTAEGGMPDVGGDGGGPGRGT
jgi:hypothetical protein